MRKRVFLVLIVLFIGINNIQAQQEPMFTQHMFNSLTINPAYAGTVDAINVNTLSRLQWVGMEGSPKTFSLSAHTPIEGKKFGVGLTLVTDKVGPVNNTFFTVNYAYQLKLTDDITLSMGLKGGINSYRVGLTGLSVNDTQDPQFQNNEKKISPNLGFGFYLYEDRYFVGFSAPKLIQTTVDEDYASTDNQLKRHYFLHGGYNWQLDPDWLIKPSLLSKMLAGSPMSIDITAQAMYKDWLGGGLVYRIGDALGLFANCKVYKELRIGYGYEYSLNGLSGINSGTHEIMLTYNFDVLTKQKRREMFHF